MKLLVLQEKLKEGVTLAEKVSPKMPSLIILNNVLVKTEKNFINLITTDLELTIKWWSLANVEKEGQITIPAKLFSTLINCLPNKQVLLEEKGLSLFIECENYKTTLKGLNPEDFPIIPQISGGESLLVDSQSFCRSLKQVVDIPFPSTTKPEISGVYLVFQKDLIRMAATDTFRLSEKTLFIPPNSLSMGYALILPQKAAREVINIFGEKEGSLQIYFSPNQFLFELPLLETPHPQIQLISRLIEGEYPDYQEILPKKFETRVVFSRNEFLNQIKSASLFSGKTSEVKLKINPKGEKIEIFSQNPDLGEYHSHLTGKGKGKEFEVSFNHRFLVDGLLDIKSSEVAIELNEAEGPVVFKPVGDQSFLYVVMPIKTG